MLVEKKELGKGQVELTIEVPVADLESYLRKAALRLSKKSPLQGFRPGAAPFELMKNRFGEQALYDEAVDDIISATLWQTLKEQQIDSVGRPALHVRQKNAGGPFRYTAIVSMLPSVEVRAWHDIRVTEPLVSVADEELDAMIEDVRSMQASEALVNREARVGDKVEVDFEVRRDGVVMSGGSGKKFPAILGKGTLIPGFEEQLLGLRASEKKEFILRFPKPYFQESLAGTEAQFAVTMLAVYERVLPEKNDAWAQATIGKSYDELRAMLRENLLHEKRHKAERDRDQRLIESIIARTVFSELPAVLIEAEVATMMAELEDDISTRGMRWDRYLQSIKKTRDDLAREFEPQAQERVKGAMVLRTLARELSLEASRKDIEEELARQKEQYAGNAEALARLDTDDFRKYLGITLTNRMVMEELAKRLSAESA